MRLRAGCMQARLHCTGVPTRCLLHMCHGHPMQMIVLSSQNDAASSSEASTYVSVQVRLRVGFVNPERAAPAAAAQADALRTDSGGFIDSKLVRTPGTLITPVHTTHCIACSACAAFSYMSGIH